MKKIAILGPSGMLGSCLFSVFSKTTFKVTGITRNELDAQTASINDIQKVIKSFDYIINCIGIIKPYIHDHDSFEVQRALQVNALFPHKLAEATSNSSIKVIQIATDCVFDGKKGKYTETDKHNAIDVYGKTKSLGEVVAPHFINLRCSIIGLEQKNKTSLLEWFLGQAPHVQLQGFQNHYWNGITTLAFAKICIGIIQNDINIPTLQHIVAQNIVSKSQMLLDFADTFNRQDIQINEVNAIESIDRSLATKFPNLNQLLWQKAGYTQIPTVKEMIQEISDNAN